MKRLPQLSQNDSLICLSVKHENEKKRHYNRRIMDIEHGTFTPLVFFPSAVVLVLNAQCSINMLQKRLRIKQTNVIKRLFDNPFIFLIIRSCLLCIRGSRSNRVAKEKELDDFEIAVDALKCDV